MARDFVVMVPQLGKVSHFSDRGAEIEAEVTVAFSRTNS